MKPLDFEYWASSEGYFPDKYSVNAVLSGHKRLNESTIVDYHHNYMRLRARIEELEGKIYALQETIDGRG